VWLNDVIHEQIERYRGYAEEKHIKIDSSALHSISVIGDAYWMNIMISNLLDNVIKFSPDKGTITIGVSEKEKRVFISISDEGKGVGNEAISLLTKRFYRCESHSHLPGTGLGLSIVSRIINSHKGDLILENLQEKGFKAIVILPVA